MTVSELLTRHDVAMFLGVKFRVLTWWLYAFREPGRYTTFEISRRSGEGTRTICAPIKPIKEMQPRLAKDLARYYDPRPNVHGFVAGRSPKSNAAPHQRQEWVLHVDLKDFFPGINYGRVRGLFMAQPFDCPHDVATTLAQLCCYRNELPQGAPTSPIVSNLICRSMDSTLAQVAIAERCFYTRYADDIAFSTRSSVFPPFLASRRQGESAVAGDGIREVIEGNGFCINDGKTRLLRRTQRQRVTGLVVNEKLNVSSDYIRDLRNVLHIWRCHGRADAESRYWGSRPPPNLPPGVTRDFKLVIRGRVQHVGHTKGWGDDVYRRLALELQAVDADFQPRTLRILTERTRVVLYVEGESDVLHFRSAQRYFNDKGRFLNLDLVLPEDSAQGSDAALRTKCEGLAHTQQTDPTVCLFDRDGQSNNERILRGIVGPDGLKDHGHGVVAMTLVHPSWRDPNSGICVEMLHHDATLHIEDSARRRVYLREEFHEPSGIHRDGGKGMRNARDSALVEEEVDGHETLDSIAMTKMDFAQNVEQGDPPWDTVDFEGFAPTFQAISEAIARLS